MLLAAFMIVLTFHGALALGSDMVRVAGSIFYANEQWMLFEETCSSSRLPRSFWLDSEQSFLWSGLSSENKSLVAIIEGKMVNDGKTYLHANTVVRISTGEFCKENRIGLAAFDIVTMSIIDSEAGTKVSYVVHLRNVLNDTLRASITLQQSPANSNFNISASSSYLLPGEEKFIIITVYNVPATNQPLPIWLRVQLESGPTRWETNLLGQLDSSQQIGELRHPIPLLVLASVLTLLAARKKLASKK